MHSRQHRPRAALSSARCARTRKRSSRSKTLEAASPPSVSGRSSTITSRPKSRASDSAWRSRKNSSSSSAEQSRYAVRSAWEPPSRCASRSPRLAPHSSPPSKSEVWLEKRNPARIAPGPGGSSLPRRWTSGPLLLLRQDGVFQLLRNTRLDDGLCGNLDGFTRRRIPAHARFPLLHDELHHPRQHELTGALQLLLGERRQLIEELARLRPLHFEPFGEVRKQFRFAHASGVCHHVPQVWCAPPFRAAGQVARSRCRGNFEKSVVMLARRLRSVNETAHEIDVFRG